MVARVMVNISIPVVVEKEIDDNFDASDSNELDNLTSNILGEIDINDYLDNAVSEVQTIGTDGEIDNIYVA